MIIRLVIGPIRGQFSVFSKISKLHSKKAFSFAIVLGDLFASASASPDEAGAALSSLLEGQIEIPLTTYFTLGKHPLPSPVREKLETSDGELCPNLYFLGKHSTTKTSEGLRIVTLGGSLSSTVEAQSVKDIYSPYYTELDAKQLHGANLHHVDILVSSDWPASIRTGSQISLPFAREPATEEQCVADLCLALRPRYHFCASSDSFYEREPFYHDLTAHKHGPSSVTRFINLAPAENQSEQKWRYAFSIDCSASPPAHVLAGATSAPFTSSTSSKKRQRLPDQGASFTRFSSQGNGHLDHYRPYKRARHRQPLPSPQECFFCLSNPNLATHLITSIGNDSYLTTAKGPLSTAKSHPTVPFPAHVLIIPLSHSPTLSSVTPPDIRLSTYREMQRYRCALQALVAFISKGALGAVTWEVSRAEGIHTHWQFLPVPKELIKKGLVDAAFKVEAENEKYPGFRAKEIGDGSSEMGDYFRVWVWQPPEGVEATLDISEEGVRTDENQGGMEVSMVMPLSSSFRFDLQFGRRVMAKLLGLEGRLHWRDCEQTSEEEKTEADLFKEAFKTFDFSLKEE